MSKSKTDHETIERRETGPNIETGARVGAALVTGGISEIFMPNEGHETKITDNNAGTSVAGTGATSAEADQNAWDRLESERHK